MWGINQCRWWRAQILPVHPGRWVDQKCSLHIKAVGIMHLATMTGPNIAYATHVSAHFNCNPEMAYWKPVKHVFRYLKGTVELKLKYEPDPNIVLSGDRISHFNMVRTSVSTLCQWTLASPCSAETDTRHMDHVHPWYVYPIPTLLPKTR